MDLCYVVVNLTWVVWWFWGGVFVLLYRFGLVVGFCCCLFCFVASVWFSGGYDGYGWLLFIVRWLITVCWFVVRFV